jgi:hypothetical protein
MLKTKTQAASAPEAERLNTPDSKFNAVIDVGEASHQGDWTFVVLAERPKWAKPITQRQLSPGTSKGSRHVVERGQVYAAPPYEIAASIQAATKGRIRPELRFLGPVIVSPDDPTADDITHPEHGNQGFPAGCVLATVRQRRADARGERLAAD